MRRKLLYACAASLLVTAIVAAAVRLGFSIPAASETGVTGAAGAASGPIVAAVRPWAILGVSYVLLVLAVVKTMGRTDRGQLGGWFRPSFGDFTTGVLGAIVLFGVVFVGQKVLTPAGTPREAWLVRLYLMLGDPALLRAHLTLLVLAVALMAAAEEIVWRGYVLRILTTELGNVGAVVVAALLYALANVPTMYALADGLGAGAGGGDSGAGLNPLLPLAALAGGLLWGTMVRMSKGRLVPAIIAHALFDWCVLVQFRLWGPSV
jgi:membrane protease YdiL (CAAX protease family)